MIKRSKLLSLSLSAAFLFCGQSISYAETASKEEQKQPETPLYETGISCSSEDALVTKTTALVYSENSFVNTYTVSNPTDKTITCTLTAPEITSLSFDPQNLYDFSVSCDNASADFTISEFYTPVFSASGLSENMLPADKLVDIRDAACTMPTDAGVLYTVNSTNGASASECMKISDISDNCHIYPLCCSYTSSDNGYSLSSSDSYSTCYVFLTGKPDTDFTVENADSTGFSIESADSSLDEFLDFCCSWYLDNNSVNDLVSSDMLLADLSDYFSKSSVTVSLDLLPTLNWMMVQKRFLIYSCSFDIAPGKTVNAEVKRNYAISPKETVIQNQLSKASSAVDEFYVSAELPEGYSSAAVRNTGSKKTDSEEGYVKFSINEFKDDSYSVALFKTPLWNGTLKYLPVFIVIMIVFMGLCCISYFTGRKKSAAEASGKK